jgi:hypothetical protein
LFVGHDDRLRRADGRIYLECDECGRVTHGWDLSAPALRRPPRTLSLRLSPQRVRVIFSQLIRGRFHAAGLR